MSLPISLPVPPEPLLVATTAAPATGRIYTSLPRIWIGFTIALMCLFSEALRALVPGPDGDAFEGLVWVTSMVGSCYWLFCVHRIHKVIAEFTNSSYPISPRRAVGFQFIPVFEYYWFFRWTRQLARFLDERSGTNFAPKVWPGLLLAAASLLGWYPPLKSLRLLLIFSFGLYLTRKLRRALPKCQPLRVRRSQQWNLSMSAGVGAAFSFVLVQALRHFSAADAEHKVRELATILLVSIAVLIFLEPVFDRLRVVLGVAETHTVVHAHRPWHLRLAVFLIVAFTSLFHGLLDSEIKQSLRRDSAGTITMLLAALLVSGGITYFWIAAAHRRPSHAARTGLISGAALGFLVGCAVLATVTPTAAGAEPSNVTLAEAFHREFPLVPGRIIHELEAGELSSDSGFTQTLLIALPWPIFGLVGGLAIDRRWGGRVYSVALAMFVAAALYCGVLALTGQLASKAEIASHLSVTAGWGLALIVCSSSAVLMPEEHAEAAAHPAG